MPQMPETSPPNAAPSASITDQVAELRALAAPNSSGAGDVGQDGVARRKEEAADAELDRGQRVEQPDLIGVAHEQKPKYRHGAGDVGDDENRLAVVAIGRPRPRWG